MMCIKNYQSQTMLSLAWNSELYGDKHSTVETISIHMANIYKEELWYVPSVVYHITCKVHIEDDTWKIHLLARFVVFFCIQTQEAFLRYMAVIKSTVIQWWVIKSMTLPLIVCIYYLSSDLLLVQFNNFFVSCHWLLQMHVFLL